jgi:hypothetical protein
LKPLPLSKRIADHIIPLEQRPDLAYERSNLAVSCAADNRRRGHNAKLPDPEAPAVPPRPRDVALTVGGRMAAILRDPAA